MGEAPASIVHGNAKWTLVLLEVLDTLLSGQVGEAPASLVHGNAEWTLVLLKVTNMWNGMKAIIFLLSQYTELRKSCTLLEGRLRFAFWEGIVNGTTSVEDGISCKGRVADHTKDRSTPRHPPQPRHRRHQHQQRRSSTSWRDCLPDPW